VESQTINALSRVRKRGKKNFNTKKRKTLIRVTCFERGFFFHWGALFFLGRNSSIFLSSAGGYREWVVVAEGGKKEKSRYPGVGNTSSSYGEGGNPGGKQKRTSLLGGEPFRRGRWLRYITHGGIRSRFLGGCRESKPGVKVDRYTKPARKLDERSERLHIETSNTSRASA